MLMLWHTLLEAGVFTNAVPPPAAPTGRLRTSYMATHTEEQLGRVLEVFAWAGRKLGFIPAVPPAEPAPMKLALGF